MISCPWPCAVLDLASRVVFLVPFRMVLMILLG